MSKRKSDAVKAAEAKLLKALFSGKSRPTKEEALDALAALAAAGRIKAPSSGRGGGPALRDA